ncbi:Ribonuclease H-like domain [Trinorchestia longiramus]|nr:Ribonuclease H-like domain [Trinorchestia longiramus]
MGGTATQRVLETYSQIHKRYFNGGMHGQHKRKHASYSYSRTHHEKKRKEKAPSTVVDMSSKNKPTLKLSRAGREAELTVSPATRQPLLLSDLRSQIHWACLRNYYDPYSLDWCSLTKKPSQVTVIVVEGISMAVLEELSLRRKKVKACYEELLQHRLRAPLDDATARYGTPHCDGWSQADQSHLAAGNGTQDFTTTPSTNNWNNGHAQGGEVPEACVSSTLQAFMPNCCRYLDVRLEMVAPSKHQQAILHELFLIRCPSSVAASIKSGNLICPRTLVEVMPNPELRKKHKSDESDWQDYDTNPCSGEVPAYEDIMKIWSISQSANTLKTSLKWTKPNKKVISTNAVQSDQFDRRKMMLSLEQLIKLKFPLPAYVSNMFAEDHLHSAKFRFQDWSFCVATKDVYAKVTPSSPMFGVDCEFVLEASEARTALGSIAIVNEHGCLVYQSLVKPDKPVLDYMTPWSGLTEQMLAPVTTSLADVQARIRKYLPPDAILVGHSLENDLRVMKVNIVYLRLNQFSLDIRSRVC